MSYTRGESLGPCRVGEPCPAPLRVAMRSPLPFPCVPDRPYKILLAQVGTLSFSHPLFGVSVLFILMAIPSSAVTMHPKGTPAPTPSVEVQVSETRVDLSNDMTWRQMIGVGVRRVVLARGELDKLEGPNYAARRAELCREEAARRRDRRAAAAGGAAGRGRGERRDRG